MVAGLLVGGLCQARPRMLHASGATLPTPGIDPTHPPVTPQEALYEEDAGAKAAAAAAVAQLCRDPGALPALLGHPSLLAALARLLREDARRSDELAVSLLAAFYALSHLPEAHGLLAKVGALAGGRVVWCVGRVRAIHPRSV